MRTLSVLAAAAATAAVSLTGTAPAAADPGPPGATCGITKLCLVVDNGTGALTAWGYYDVTGTGYGISIWKASTGVRQKLCVTGTSCTSSVFIGPPPGTCAPYVAHIGSTATTLPLNPTIRTSNTVTLCTP